MTTLTIDKLDTEKLFNLVNEAKRTSCYTVANYATAVLLGYKEKTISWETKEKLPEWSNNWNNDFQKDLVVIKVDKYSVCIPATHLKEIKAKECYVASVTTNNVVQKLIHRRKKKLCLPGQYEYLLRKLTRICPNWRDFVDSNLNVKVV
jgi:hypothetical protein